MARRFRRGRQGTISFFAFQDIITSVIGILLVIVLMMAMQLGDALPVVNDEPRSPVLQAMLDRLLDALSQAQAALHREQGDAAANDPAVLTGETEMLTADLEAAQAEKEAREGRLAILGSNPTGDIARAEVARKAAELAAAKKQAEELAARVAASREAMNELETTARDKDARLLAEQSAKNKIWLIPDRANSSKEPVLAVVSSGSLTLQKFGAEEKADVKSRWGQARALRSALESYSSLDQYVVFYFKPSGLDQFDTLTAAARESGFEIGYDAIPEDVEITFGPVNATP